MEGIGSGLSGTAAITKKRRSITIRRPRPESQLILDGSPPSSTPSSENASKLSTDDNESCEVGIAWKEFDSSGQKVASLSKIEDLVSSRKSKKEDRKFGDADGFYGTGNSRGLAGSTGQGSSGYDLKRCSEGALAPANWKAMNKVKDSYDMHSRSSDGHNSELSAGAPSGSTSAENKLRKVKLKVGGVTRTIHAKSNPEAANDGSSGKPPRSSDPSRLRHRISPQDNSNDDLAPHNKGVGGSDSIGGSSSYRVKEDTRSRIRDERLPMKRTEDVMSSSETLRKSKRVPKRRLLDGELQDGDNDNEVRYLDRLKTSKSTSYGHEYEDEGEDSKKRNLSKISIKARKTTYQVDEDYNLLQKKKGKAGRESDDTDYVEEEEEERFSDDASEAKKKKQKKDSAETIYEARAEPLTTRQRALQSGKGSGTPFIEFPNGLPPAAPRKQKEKLSEEEQQAKKEEAARRRKMQVEKQNKEIRAAAISKILGHDSKKKTERDQEEKAQERAAEALTLPSNTVRWVMGPSGTIVTFAEDVGLPNIFNSKSCSYPPPRQKCTGPSCTNPYKYRDSKSNLPLCSLRCYKAVREKTQPLPSC